MEEKYLDYQKEKNRYYSREYWKSLSKEKKQENRKKDYNKHKEKRLKKSKDYYEKCRITEKFKKYKREIAKRYRLNNKDKIIVQRISKSIKIPEGQLCQRCNINKAIEKHHPDYFRPFYVIFVCSRCHYKLNRGEI